MTGTGEAAGSQYATELEIKKTLLKRKGESLAESGKSGASSVDATETGGNFADGFGSGISSRAGHGEVFGISPGIWRVMHYLRYQKGYKKDHHRD